MDLATAQHIRAVMRIAYMGVTTINVATDNGFGLGPVLSSTLGFSLDGGCTPQMADDGAGRNQWSQALRVGVDWRLIDTSTLQSDALFEHAIMCPPDLLWKPQAVGRKNSFVLYDGLETIQKIRAVRAKAQYFYDKYTINWDQARSWEPYICPTPKDFGHHLMFCHGRWLAKVYDLGTWYN